MNTLRPPAVAGMFYPADANTLLHEVRALLAQTPTLPDSPQPKALIVPHAGYVYSGAVAASAYALLAPWRKKIRRVALFGPTHRVAVQGLAVGIEDGYATPLGAVPLDAGLIQRVLRIPGVLAYDAAHAEEHSLEVQLPFLQAVLDEFTLIPFAVGAVEAATVAKVMDALWGDDETLIVVSSDLSHYLPYAAACERDARSVERILHLTPLTSHEEACGATPINGLLETARQRALRPVLLAACNSGDTAGDKTRVVGYAAFAFYSAPPAAQDAEEAEAEVLGQALLARARNSIAAALHLPAEQVESAHPALLQPAATFVTLTLNGQLRGCIGSLEAHRTLDEDVRANALAAAFHDPRFPPLTAPEFKFMQVEVSRLTAPQALEFADEADLLRQLRPHIDGVIFSCANHRATFLPQVWAMLPQPQDFMRQLKQKAGLPADFWDAAVEVKRYAVQKWAE